MNLNQKKLPHVTFVLAGRSWKDHISGPPGGTNNFSSPRILVNGYFKEVLILFL